MDKKMVRAKQLGYDVEDFSKKFINAFYELKESYKLIGLDITEFMPKPFNDLEHMVLDSVFYYQKEIFVINFYSKEKSSFHYNVEFDDVWQSNIFKRNENGEINNFYTLASPVVNLSESPSLNIYGLGMAFTIEEFEKALIDVKKIAYYMLQSQLPLTKVMKSKFDAAYLDAIALEFKILLDTEGLLEKDVELFLNKNTEILEYTLNFKSVMSQPDLKNVLGKFPHDLKPDLIGFDAFHKRWVILDYKKHEKSLVKNLLKSRTGFTAEVNSLADQLGEYRKYFEEKDHRDYFLNRYGLSINRPYTIGLIGLIEEEEVEAFNELLERNEKWFDLYPYNLLLDGFIKEIEKIKKHSIR